MSATDHVLYAGLWLSFALGHSLLASSVVKQATQGWLGSRYRFIYNCVALAHICLVLAIGRLFLSEPGSAFDLPMWLRTTMIAVQCGGALILVLALRQYDLGLFLGTKQLRDPNAGNTLEPLNTSGINGWVRHPLYLGSHLILWGAVSDPFTLATALWGSLYFWIGARYEERRLVALYGEAYRQYQKTVPFQFPGFQKSDR